jgi:transcriptional regulator with XRE-family HTH domain
MKKFLPAPPIKQARTAIGVTAANLGRAAGMSTSKVYRVERDLGRARFRDVAALRDALRRLAAEGLR